MTARPARTVRHCQAIRLSDNIILTLAARTPLTLLYTGADQDGWNGALICRLESDVDAAFEREDVEIVALAHTSHYSCGMYVALGIVGLVVIAGCVPGAMGVPVGDGPAPLLV